MKRPETISVIIPAYNAEAFLAEAVESALSQSFPAHEIIVVDDGSTDRTPEVAKKYNGRIKYVRQENAGPACARNRGIRLATGEYVAFLDADDIWKSDKLEEQVRAFRENPAAALVYSKINVINSKKVNSSARPAKAYSGKIFDNLLVENFILLSTVVVRSSALREVGCFDESLFTAEDTNLYLKLAKLHEIVCVDKVLVYYRKHGKNISDRFDIKVGTLDNLDNIIRRFPDTAPGSYPPMKEAYIRRGTSLLRDYFSHSLYRECNATCRRLLGIKASEPSVLFYFALTKLPAPVLDVMRKVRSRVKESLRK